MPSPWIQHVKNYQQEHNCSYKQALSGAKETYQRKSQGGSVMGSMTGMLVRNPATMIGKLTGQKQGFSPKVQDILNKYGNAVIKRIQIWRSPVGSTLINLLDIVSLGEFKKRFAKEPYDKLFHLALCLETTSGNIRLEKNEIFSADVRPVKKPKTEVMIIPSVPSGLTVNTLINNARKRLGDTKFFRYSARDSNCQHMCLALVQSSNLGNSQTDEFIKQDVSRIFEGLTFLRKASNTITDIGAAAQVVAQGGEIQPVPRPRPRVYQTYV